MILDALAPYGATLDKDGVICRNEKPTGVCVKFKKGRIRFQSTETGQLIMSGPANVGAVERFVEGFWYWRKPDADFDRQQMEEGNIRGTRLAAFLDAELTLTKEH